MNLKYVAHVRIWSEFLLLELAEGDLAGYHFECNVHILIRSLYNILYDFMMIIRSEQVQACEFTVCDYNTLVIILDAYNQKNRMKPIDLLKYILEISKFQMKCVNVLTNCCYNIFVIIAGDHFIRCRIELIQ